MTDDAPTKRGRPILRGGLVALGVVALLGVVAWLLLDAMSDRRDDRIRAKGYPVTAVEFEAWLPSPPAGENAAQFYVEAGKLIDDTTFVQKKLLPGFGDDDAIPGVGERIGAGVRAAVAAFIEHESDAFDFIDDGSQRSESNYGMPITPMGNVAPHLSLVRTGARAQRLRVFQAMSEDDADAAIEEFSKLVAVTRSMRREPLLRSAMVYVALAGLTVDTAEQVVNDGFLDDGHLVALDGQLALLLDDQGLVPALIGERCCYMTSITGPGNSVPIFDDWTKTDVLSAMDEAIELAEIGFPEGLDTYEALSNRSPSWFRVMSSMTMPGYLRAMQSYYEMRARVLAARAAIAIERARAGGAAPKDFMSLPDSVRANWPIDPFTGQAMIYARVDDGYVVYSIGGDLKDGGGFSRAELHDPSGQQGGRGTGVTGRALGDAVFRVVK